MKRNIFARLRAASCVAAALVLTACAALAPGAPGAQPAQQGEFHSLHQTLSRFGSSNTGNHPQQLYRRLALEDRTLLATAVSYADGVQRILCSAEGCAHSGPECTAFLCREEENMYATVVFGADAQQLYCIVDSRASGQNAGGQVTLRVSDPDGANGRSLMLSTAPVMHGQPLYAAQDALYWMQSTYAGEEKQMHQLVETSFVDGTQRVVQQWEDKLSVSALACGTLGLLVVEQAMPEYPALPAEDAPQEEWERYGEAYQEAWKAMLCEIRPYSLAQGLGEVLFSFTQGEYEDYVLDGVLFYGVPHGTGSVIEHNLQTGAQRTVYSGLPQGNVMLQIVPDGKLLADVTPTQESPEGTGSDGAGEDAPVPEGPGLSPVQCTRVCVDPAAGTAAPLTLTIRPAEESEMQYPLPVQLLCAGEQGLAVQREYQTQRRAALDSEGTRYEYEQQVPQYSVFSWEDFYASAPKGTPVQLLGPEYWDAAELLEGPVG